MDNPEKLATLGIHDEEKQIKNTIRHEPSYKQLGLKTNRTSLLCGYRNGHQNTELRMLRQIIEQHKKLKR